jgi:hypothetical protein
VTNGHGFPLLRRRHRGTLSPERLSTLIRDLRGLRQEAVAEEVKVTENYVTMLGIERVPGVLGGRLLE